MMSDKEKDMFGAGPYGSDGPVMPDLHLFTSAEPREYRPARIKLSRYRVFRWLMEAMQRIGTRLRIEY